MSDTANRTELSSKKGGNKEKTLIFLHTYKTGGTTLHSMIQRIFPRDAIFDFLGGNSQEEVQENAELLGRLFKKDRPRIRYIWGAPFVGLHEYLCQPYIYFTLIRNPVDRVISEYYHVMRGGPIGNESYAKNIDLEDYVRNPTMLSWNAQVSSLKGVPEGAWPLSGAISLSADDLEKAGIYAE